jgi:hypothetical protein
MTTLEKAALALKANLGEQLNAKPLLGDASSGDWYSDGTSGSIECTDLVRAVLTAIRGIDSANAVLAAARETGMRASEVDLAFTFVISAILSEADKQQEKP